MGGVISTEHDGNRHELAVRVVGTANLERLDVIRSGQVVDQIPIAGRRELTAIRSLTALRPGEYVYIRVLQTDGGLAWSSPVFVD